MTWWTCRPLGDRTPFTGEHAFSDFRASWDQTEALLLREINALDGGHVAVELDVDESRIRADGRLHAQAVVRSPAVRIAFESRYGPLQYATDRFRARGYRDAMQHDWQHNVRAIALGLEALRQVDRYGITRRGEQYAGWKALPATALGATLPDPADALTLLIVAAELEEGEVVGTGDPERLRRLFRQARARAHPDRHGGNHEPWRRVEDAGRVLGLLDGDRAAAS